MKAGTFAEKNGTWEIATEAGTVFVYRPETGVLDELRAVHQGASVCLTQGGGPLLVLAGKEHAPDSKGLQRGITRGPQLSADQKELSVSFVWGVGDDKAEFQYVLSAKGKRLSVKVSSQDTKFRAFISGRAQGEKGLRLEPLIIPVMDYSVGTVSGGEKPLYISSQLSEASTNASRYETRYRQDDERTIGLGHDTFYDTRSDGKTRHPLNEELLLVMSEDLADTFRDLPQWCTVSPYLAELSDRVTVDIWHGQKDKFRFEREKLEKFKRFGLDRLLVLQHVWQRQGYDAGLPDVLPPNQVMGGEAELKKFLETARSFGYRVALHENYTDEYPDAPSFDPKAACLDPDGTPRKAWYCSTTGQQGFCIKPRSGNEFQARFAPEIHKLGTNASFIDVITAINLGQELDYDIQEEGAGMLRPTGTGNTRTEGTLAQIATCKTVHEGPFIGEGGHHALYAGVCDGAEAELTRVFWDGRENVPRLLDFDLNRVHHRMVNQGVGYIARFLDSKPPYSADQYQKVRAVEIAFGHAGWIDFNTRPAFVDVFREYYCLQQLQARYNLARPTEIRYEHGGSFVDLSAAVAAKALGHSRVVFDNGLTVWVNCREDGWGLEAAGKAYELGAHSWLALDATGAFKTYSLLQDGVRTDYLQSSEYLYAYTARPVERTIEKLVTDGGLAVKKWEQRAGRNVYAVYSTVAGLAGEPELLLKASTRCDLSLEYLSDLEFEIQVADVWYEAGVSVNYFDLPASMKKSAKFSICQLDMDGNDIEVTATWKMGEKGELVLHNLLETNRYRVKSVI